MSPSALHFDDCGDTETITITAVACGTATVTIHTQWRDWQAEGGKNAVFSDEVINVTVGGSTCSTDPPVTACAKPAAPAWAVAILQKNNIKPKQADNWVSKVAQEMLPGASFPDWSNGDDPRPSQVDKVDQNAYAAAVEGYLETLNGASDVHQALVRREAARLELHHHYLSREPLGTA